MTIALSRSTGWSSLSSKGESRAGAGGREFVRATLGASLSTDIYPLGSFTCEDAEKLFPPDHSMKIRYAGDNTQVAGHLDTGGLRVANGDLFEFFRDSATDFLLSNSLTSNPILSIFLLKIV